MLLKEAALVKLLLPPALASLKFRVAFSQTWLRPSSEEHGHPLVDKIERNASALQRSDGWEAARGAAEGLLESPEGVASVWTVFRAGTRAYFGLPRV